MRSAMGRYESGYAAQQYPDPDVSQFAVCVTMPGGAVDAPDSVWFA